MTHKFEYFGKYILLEKLATGGMAEVFLARKTGADGIGKFCAIKRILPQFADSPEFIDMFRDEAKIAINLNHSNIVSIHEFGIQKDQFFIVMDYVEGRNLRQILNKMKKTGAKFSTDQIVYMIKEIAAGLDHAHRCLDGTTGKPLNITHRDMSPQNVMVSFEGELKIVDFGIAKAESQMETTRAGTLKGKFGYMSPEQAEGQPVDLRTDIFSLGIVLWELLANDRLFIANNEINTLRKIRDCQVPSLRKINPNIQTELDRIAQKALARDRNLRYQTAAALHRDMSRFLNRQYPDFSPHDFSVFIKTLFADEILNTRKRVIEYAKIPFQEAVETRSKPKPSKEAVSTDTIVTGTNTSSYIDSKPKVDEDSFIDGPPRGLTNATPDNARFSGLDAPEASEPSLDIKSFSAVEAEEASSQENKPPKEGGLGVLDEGALAKELERELNIKAPSPYALETEDQLDNSRTGFTNHTNTSHTQSHYTRSIYVTKKRSSFNFLSLIVFFAMSLSSYAVAIKFMTQTMQPLISALDPVMSPLHRALNVSGHANNASTQNENGSLEGLNFSNNPKVEDPVPQAQTSPTQAAPTPAGTEAAPSAGQAPTKPVPPGHTVILVNSVPSRAMIYLNGKDTGVETPGLIPVPTQGEFTLELKRQGYINYVSDNLTRDKTGTKFQATLQKPLIGYIDIDVLPFTNARVYINGEQLRESLPISKYRVPANTALRITAVNPYKQSKDEKIITIGPNQRQRVMLDLRSSDRQPSQR